MIEKLTAAPGCLVSDSAFAMKAEPSSNFHGLDGLRDDLSITFLVEASPVQVYFFSVVVVIEIHIRIRIHLSHLKKNLLIFVMPRTFSSKSLTESMWTCLGLFKCFNIPSKM